MKYSEKILPYIAKNQLTYTDNKELLELYRDEDLYYNFITMIIALLEDDQQFLASFPIAIDHILEVINQGRFQFKTVGDMREIENKIILLLNQIEANATEEIKNNYRKQQEKLRGHLIQSDMELAELVASDILVIRALESDQSITIDKQQFISSTSLLIEQFPELYLDYPEHIEKTLNYIGVADKQESTYIRKSTKLIHKVLKKYNKLSKRE